jgi:DNA primase
VQRDGPAAMNAAVEESVPFVRFRVERVLAEGEDSSPEGRDRMIDELRPVFAMLPPSAMRMELTRMVSGRLALPESLAETLLAPASGRRERATPNRSGEPRTVGSPPPRGGGLSRREDTERAFLALCIASPDEGARTLAGLDVDEHFASEVLRRAARHLHEGNLREPMTDSASHAGGLDGDPELKGLLAELVVEAGRWSTSDRQPRPAMLDVQRLQLELARVDRNIQQARGQESGDVSELAQRRAEVKHEFDRAYGRALEETGD